MKCFFSLIVACSLFCAAYAQKEGNHWFFGDKAGINFNSGTPVFEAGSLGTREGCSSLSDANGNLLFYTNGVAAWNRNHVLMPNGGFGPSGILSSTQAALIVPQPGNDSIYYIFFTAQIEFTTTKGLFYVIVNMHRDGGLGDVIGPYTQLFAGVIHEKIAAIKHGNGHDIWVVIHEAGSNVFLEYKITDQGIPATPVSVAAGGTTDGGIDRMGYLKFSPDGTRIAMACTNSRLEIFNFNNQTGEITNSIVIPRDATQNCRGNYGVEFSCNSKLIYTTVFFLCSSGNAETYLLQYKIDYPNINDVLNSKVVLDSFLSSNTNPGALQIAPNGKIIVAMEPHNYVGCITDPNVYGTGCGFVPQYMSFPVANKSQLGLPNFVQSNFFTSPKIKSDPSCSPALTVAFGLEGINLYDSLRWDFGDPASGASNSSNMPVVNHIFSSGGFYTVTAYIYTRCKTDSLKKQVTVGNTNQLLGPDTNKCPGASFTARVNVPGATYLWQNAATTDSLLIQSPGQYWVSITVNGCVSTDTLNVYDKPLPVFGLGKDSTICENASLHFDLTGTGDSFLWQDQSTSPLYNITGAGTYIVKVTLNGCSKSDSININVKLLPAPKLGDDKTICRGQELILNPGEFVADYLWQDGSIGRVYNVSTEGLYKVTVSNECGIGNDDIMISSRNCNIYWPSSFTPNDDARNKEFKVLGGVQFLSFKLRIFNRWGGLVFSSENPSDGWDGNYKNKKQPQGVYAWVAEYTELSGLRTIEKGTIMLIR